MGSSTYDIIIIGGGPAGLSFAKSLADTDLKIAVIEKSPENVIASPEFDGRDIALTHFSIELLKKLDIWKLIPANKVSEIKEAKVLNGTSPFALHFDKNDTEKDFLGCLVSNHIIRKAVYESVKPVKNIDLITDIEVTAIETSAKGGVVQLSDGREITCPLIVAADSRFSNMRRKMGISASMNDFGRTVIVCRMEHELPHNQIAHECFHYDQTLAVLPLSGNSSSIVITIPSDKADDIINMDDKVFNEDIQNRFENRLGKMKLSTKKYSYPLVGVYAKQFVKTRFALMGDAAVGMHPVTAHGYNLGLKGAHVLANEIKQAKLNGLDIGGQTLLETYQKKHRLATKPIYLGTNALVAIYTAENKPAKFLRDSMLKLGSKLPPVKRLIMNQLTEIKSLEK